MDWAHEPLAESYKAFKARMELFLLDHGISNLEKQAIKIRIALGDEGMRRVLASGLTDAQQKKPDKIWEFIESQVDASVKINFRVHRLEFAQMRQKPQEQLINFVSRLRQKALRCDFEQEELCERLIESIILSTPIDDYRKELLTYEKGYAITDVIEKGQEFEAVIAAQSSLREMSLSKPAPNTTQVDVINKQNQSSRECQNCGTTHPPKSCPAYQSTCAYCRNKGHWFKCCRNKRMDERDEAKPAATNSKAKRRKPFKPKVHAIDQDAQATSEYFQFSEITFSDIAIDANDSDHEAFVNLPVRHKSPPVSGKISLKVDTGSGGNTLPMRTYRQMFHDIPTEKLLTPEPNLNLTSYSGTRIPFLGSIHLEIQKPNHPNYINEKFYVVNVKGPAILGLPTCKKLNLVKFNIDAMNKSLPSPIQNPDNGRKPILPKLRPPITSVAQLKVAYPQQFDRIGNFKTPAKLHLKDNAIPFIDAPRKCSIHLKPLIKAELQKMEQEGVIQRITEHSDWCSSLVYVTKPDNSLRICLDPQRLNQSLRRCPHKIPTLEELNPAFANAKMFSKLDAKAGYWSIPLHEESQLLTTFRTPFGRYCWRRLPFGLNVSQDIFQARMDIILENLPGVVNIADDICVFGSNQAEHDQNLQLLMDRAASSGLVFNSAKCEIAKDEINFFGNRYTSDGILPDPRKIRDLNNMPSPGTKEDVQRFLGLMTYLSPFIPNYSRQAKPLRDLMKTDIPFEWDSDHEHCYTQLKQLVCKSNALTYYDAKKPLTLEVDASQKGLGAALTQDGQVIAFASKSLTQTQSNYSNIEREALGLVHGIQRFHTYLFGRQFSVITDHKPLVNIWTRPLNTAPPRLQRLFLRLQGYNFTLTYKPGSDLILSDTLSRLPNPENNREIALDLRVDGIELDDLDMIPITLLNFSNERLTQLKEQTDKDPVLRQVKAVIIEGWPESVKQCHPEIREYFNYRESLAVENGVIFKGRQVVIPNAMQQTILEQLHLSHQGVTKTQALARESVFWPEISKHIDDLVKHCAQCQKYQAQQPEESHLHQEIPPTPWTKLGSDLFQCGQKSYLLIADYFTKYPIVKELRSTTSAEVTKQFRYICGIIGCPRTIISDNGPQYTGREFKDFVNQWGIEHTTSSPKYPKANGFAERMVGTVKHLLIKCHESGSDPDKALLQLRATPVDSKTVSPGELMFGRPLITTLPTHVQPSPRQVDTQNHLSNRLQDHQGSDLKPLYSGQPVNIYRPETKTWTPGSIVSRTSQPRSYIVSTEEGTQLRRNRVQLREVPLKPVTYPHVTQKYPSSNMPITVPAQMGSDSDGTTQNEPQPTIPSTSHNPSVTDGAYRTKAGRTVKTPTRFKND